MQLDIVIPNFNGKDFLRTCLNSLRQQSYVDFTIIVVDNGSTDGSVALLESEYPEVQLLAWPENRGFSIAVNGGIKAGSAPLVFLLNNDTELDPHCLEKLVDAAGSHPDYDFFAAKMLSFHNREILDGAGDAFLRGGVGYRLGTMEPDSAEYSRSRQVFGACAGAALYRREFFTELGSFDEDFFAYLEDVDLNLRAARRGRKCRYIAEAKVYHIGSATTGSKINPFTVRLSTRNNLCLLLKNYPFILLLRFSVVIAVYQFFWLCFVIEKGQFPAYCQGLLGFVKLVPKMLKKRRKNCELASRSSSELAAILNRAEGEVIQSITQRRAGLGKGNLLFSWYRRLFLW
jgi:GT2 family glycosyltransferase